MKMDVPLKELFNRSVARMRTSLHQVEDGLWNVADDRRSKHAVHTETRSIVFRWLDNAWIPGTPPLVTELNYAPKPLQQQAEAVASKLSSYFGGTVVKLMLAELKPGGVIAPHEDVAPALYMSHRCHLPITSNSNVDFLIEEVAYHLEPGTLYEIDNTRTHAVMNRGAATRVHLICDVMPD